MALEGKEGELAGVHGDEVSPSTKMPSNNKSTTHSSWDPCVPRKPTLTWHQCAGDTFRVSTCGSRPLNIGTHGRERPEICLVSLSQWPKVSSREASALIPNGGLHLPWPFLISL